MGDQGPVIEMKTLEMSEQFSDIDPMEKELANAKETSLSYFGVKLSSVCLMIAYRKKRPIVTLR